MHKVFINKCKSCNGGNQIVFKIMLSFWENKRRSGYDINIAK